MNIEVFDLFPVLETKRLKLRQISMRDKPGILAFNSSLEMLKYVPRDPFTRPEQADEKMTTLINGFTKKTSIWWAFTQKDAHELDDSIGYGGLFDVSCENHKAELGYGLLKEHWGKGFMSEAVEAIVEFSMNTMELHRLYAYIVPGNTASEKIVKKLDFTKEGVLKDSFYARKTYFDMAVHAFINPSSQI